MEPIPALIASEEEFLVVTAPYEVPEEFRDPITNNFKITREVVGNRSASAALWPW